MRKKLKLALFISGGGTTMRAIIEACATGRLPGIEPALVIASREDAGGIEKALSAGISRNDICVIRPNRADNDFVGQCMIDTCRNRGVDLIGLYGWLPLIPKKVIEAFPERMINQHPGPLDPGRPDFGGKGMYGRRVHCARLEFVRRTGRDASTEVVAQRVHPEFDRGTVICRRSVPILPDDTTESLQARALPVEHAVQIEALRGFSQGPVFELTRTEPLVRPEEIGILAECKRVAIERYPEG